MPAHGQPPRVPAPARGTAFSVPGGQTLSGLFLLPSVSRRSRCRAWHTVGAHRELTDERTSRRRLPRFTLPAPVAQHRFCIVCVTRCSRRDRTGRKIRFLAFSIETARKWFPSLWSPRHAGKQENQCFPPGLVKCGPSAESDHCLFFGK